MVFTTKVAERQIGRTTAVLTFHEGGADASQSRSAAVAQVEQLLVYGKSRRGSLVEHPLDLLLRRRRRPERLRLNVTSRGINVSLTR